MDLAFSRGQPWPDAIFCGNDAIARGVIDALRDKGISVPADIAVIGFDNWEMVATQTRPPLTTIDMGLKALGARAGLALHGLCNGEQPRQGSIQLPCTLVERGSA